MILEIEKIETNITAAQKIIDEAPSKKASNLGKVPMKFTWDENKNQPNIHKHGIDFQDAAYVFSDPFALSMPDDERSETEERWLLFAIISQ